MAGRSLIGNKYVLLNEIGRGRFGTVYKGEHVKHKTPVAIKMEHQSQDITTIKYETTILNYLYSNGCRVIPSVLWYGVYGDYKCLTMDYYDQTVDQYIELARQKYASSPIDYLKQIIKILMNMVNILSQIHKHQIIHRDIKPENFMLKNGEIHLLDFGIAISVLSMDDIDKEPNRTTMIGSPKYVSYYVHQGYEPMYRDDLISVGYCFFYFINKELPWSNPPLLENISTVSELDLDHPKNQFRKKQKQWSNIESILHRYIEKCAVEPQHVQIYKNICEYFSLCYGLEIHEIPYYNELYQVLQISL
jgi:casein kinase 1